MVGKEGGGGWSMGERGEHTTRSKSARGCIERSENEEKRERSGLLRKWVIGTTARGGRQGSTKWTCFHKQCQRGTRGQTRCEGGC